MEIHPNAIANQSRLRRVVRRVALLNIGYFAIEFAVAAAIGSVALYADSIDFLEDTAVNLLVLLALDWSARRRAQLGLVLGLVLLAPSLAALWTAWAKLDTFVPPDAALLSITGLGALAVNLSCALMLARWRSGGSSLTRAAFLSSRNDAFANVAIIGTGLVTAFALSAWPDLIVGLAIFILNLNAAREIWEAAHQEFRQLSNS